MQLEIVATLYFTPLCFPMSKQFPDHAVELRASDISFDEVLCGLDQHTERYQSAHSPLDIRSQSLVVPGTENSMYRRLTATTCAFHSDFLRYHNTNSISWSLSPTKRTQVLSGGWQASNVTASNGRCRGDTATQIPLHTRSRFLQMSKGRQDFGYENMPIDVRVRLR